MDRNINGRPTSEQVSRVTALPAGNFTLPITSYPVLLKNITEYPISIEILPVDNEGKYIKTTIYPGWNPELIIGVKGVTVNTLQYGN